MRKVNSLRLVSVLTTGAVALCVVAGVIVNREVHAMGRFRLAQTGDYAYKPYFFTDTLAGISNFLSSANNRLILANMSKIDERRFRFEGAYGIRSTTICYVRYSGSDSSTVLSVASNAANMVVLFLATNQPGLQVGYIDSSCFTPAPPWQQLEWDFQYYLNRALSPQ